MKFGSIVAVCVTLSAVSLPAYQAITDQPSEAEQQESHVEHHEEQHASGEHHPRHKIIATRPMLQDVVSTQQYVCQIHSRNHIEVRALEGGYLEEIPVREGQSVKRGELLFKIMPVLYKAKLDSDLAEAELAQVEYDNTARLVKQNIVSDQELKLAAAKLAKAQAEVNLAKAELDFADIKAPFDGIVDRQMHQLGSLIEEGEILTTLSDNSVMWVYFNVPESRYLLYKNELEKDQDDLKVELKLANGNIFSQPGQIGAIEADFNNETGNIAFRADFPNPEGLLRNGQTGTVLIHRELKNAVVIPQRATYEILAKQYVRVIDDQGIVHQREIEVQKELEDIYVIKKGVDEKDTIVFEGAQQVRDGDHVEFEFQEPTEILSDLKHHAE